MAILFVCMAMVGLQYTYVLDDIKTEMPAKQQAYIEQEAQSLAQWYETNIMALDSIAGKVAVPGSIAGGEYGLAVIGTNRFSCNGTVQAHKFVLVIPGQSGIVRTTIDEAVEPPIVRLGKGDIVKVVDGCKIGGKVFADSQKRARFLVDSLESYFRAAELSGAMSGKNHFTSVACGGDGVIPCSDTIRLTDDNVLADSLGQVNAEDIVDAYGGGFYFDNISAEVNSATPLYTSRIGFDTPWGTRVWMFAIGKN